MIRRALLTADTSAATAASGSAGPIASQWPPVGAFLRVHGKRVHYWTSGAGPLVVLVHGASGNLRDWTFALAPRLAQTHRVVAFDRPGSGYSERLDRDGWVPVRQADHLRAAHCQITDDDPIVVGHSWGGALAMAWALDAADRTRGAVVLSGATMPWGGALSTHYSLLASRFIGPLAARMFSSLATEARANHAIADIFAPQQTPDGYGAHIGIPLATRPTTLRHNAQDLVHLNTALTEQSRRYPKLDLPVEVFHGSADTIVPADIHAKAMAHLLPNARLTVLDGIGHMPHHVATSQTLAAISRLSGTPVT
ncbi:MAG: alpha/beta hydrolase [Pseudomonadota bacterium]